MPKKCDIFHVVQITKKLTRKYKINITILSKLEKKEKLYWNYMSDSVIIDD